MFASVPGTVARAAPPSAAQSSAPASRGAEPSAEGKSKPKSEGKSKPKKERSKASPAKSQKKQGQQGATNLEKPSAQGPAPEKSAPGRTGTRSGETSKKAEKAEKRAASEADKSKPGKKTVAVRMGGSKRREETRSGKKASKPAPKPCLGTAVQIDRGGLEGERITLVTCAGKPRAEARRQLSVLARPWGTPHPGVLPAPEPQGRPTKGQQAKRGEEIAPGVRLVDPGLLVRIDALARRYPDRTISLVSGYRPRSRGSLHQTARALDLRIAGVPNHELVAACRTLTDTGCGYYPNSSFIHVDVRSPGTGVVSWIDASGPGETPRYVSAWPPPASETPASEPPASERRPRRSRPRRSRPCRSRPCRSRLPRRRLPRSPRRSRLPRRRPPRPRSRAPGRQTRRSQR
ncbi:YcbK family protein [Chondromyces apiculatus]|uniref:Ribonuclease E n=1 Tax=Chondromyces apiculatus DSM 436 TaxID=1192034 RepID=A0A017TJ39_9BACT|nr:DUF882 domain-containing protein [Chondromyces apiculatus]EYF08860.1 Ribonuclease E [Chondromyces apiculatus DSM 436]